MRKKPKFVTRRENALRAEGLQLASVLMEQLAEGVTDTPREDMRKGLLCASGFTSAMANSLRTGETEMGMINVDGDVYPIDLTLKVNE